MPGIVPKPVRLRSFTVLIECHWQAGCSVRTLAVTWLFRSQLLAVLLADTGCYSITASFATSHCQNWIIYGRISNITASKNFAGTASNATPPTPPTAIQVALQPRRSSSQIASAKTIPAPVPIRKPAVTSPLDRPITAPPIAPIAIRAPPATGLRVGGLLAIDPLCHVPPQDARVPLRDRWGGLRRGVYHCQPRSPPILPLWHAPCSVFWLTKERRCRTCPISPTEPRSWTRPL